MATITGRVNQVSTFGTTLQLYVWDCPTCGVVYGIPVAYADALRENRGSYYCPNGHRLSWSENEADRLKRQLKYAQDQAAAERARADGAEASRRAWKGQTTRLRKRILDGECPICGQHLRDVARHVARQHPGEVAELEMPI